jgi:hypothetical protein
LANSYTIFKGIMYHFIYNGTTKIKLRILEVRKTEYNISDLGSNWSNIEMHTHIIGTILCVPRSPFKKNTHQRNLIWFVG